MIANRVSAHLDLLGPSLAVDTACSSTMTAMHLAVNAIVQDECNTAVVAGCQMNHRFKDWIMYSQGSVLSPDGKCKPFDANANGFSRGEGCAAVVLRDLNLALKANDRIYGVVLGSAINSGGSGGPPGAPVAEAQQIAMKKAFQVAGCDPKNVDYIELHATGTRKGDPAEVNWVGNVFNRSEELVIGSVKGNIG
ncbi:Mycolipanoate synthase [Stygiomarasmius scandens]|uniref:Mycolipanoate synthase n=1 Tax=Marasmiellus scandens TaxID=2682957 RepID=A0ABR1IYH7_9AGAR